jgi:hypothetical protein
VEKATCVVIVVIVLLIAACVVGCLVAGVAAYAGFSADNWTQAQETVATEVSVDLPAALQVRNPVGSVTVRSGPAEGRVVVEATKEARSIWGRSSERMLDQLDVRVEPKGSNVMVDVRVPEASGTGFGRVNLVITVPADTDVDIVNETGHVTILGVEGDLRVRSETGSVRMEDVVVAASCDVMNTTGSVTFEGRLPEPGSLDEAWDVLLRTETGDIDFFVPSDSQFTLDAESETGGVTSEFELQGLQSGRQRGEVGRWLKGGVNREPNGGTVVLRTETGSIVVGPLP